MATPSLNPPVGLAQEANPLREDEAQWGTSYEEHEDRVGGTQNSQFSKKKQFDEKENELSMAHLHNHSQNEWMNEYIKTAFQFK